MAGEGLPSRKYDHCRLTRRLYDTTRPPACEAHGVSRRVSQRRGWEVALGCDVA
jgi:hypothetical protein